MTRLVLLTIALLTATAACSGDPGPTPSPTPTASGYLTYTNEVHGFTFEHPAAWTSTPAPPNGPLLILNDGGTLQLSATSYFSPSDSSLSELLDAAIELVAASLDNPSVEGRRNVVLEDGSAAERADLAHRREGTDAVTRLQIAKRGPRTFLLTLAALATELERQSESVERVLASFLSFPPAPFEVSRDRSLTMPWSDPLTLDPAVARESGSHFIVSNVFSGLVRFGADLRVRPDLAEAIQVDSAGTVYTFTLRPDAKFHDGREITSDDVKYSLERATDPKLMSDTAALYLSDIVGARDKLEGRAEEVSGVEVMDSRTVRITIDAPKAFFLAKMTYPTGAIVDRETVDSGGFEWWRSDVNGSGPFKLREWTEGEVLILERFDDYHAPSSLELAVFPILQGVPMQMYEADAVDVALIGGPNVDRALDPVGGLADQLAVFPQLNTFFLGFRAQEAPFDDPLVRRAFAMAVDREALLEAVYGGRVSLAAGLLPPGMPGYSADLVGIPYDPEGARALLAQSQYAADFPRVRYTTSGSGEVPADAQFIAGAWEANLGVDVEIELVPPDVYFYRLDELAGNIFDFGWVADYPDPENFLDLLLHSENRSNNIGGYSNPEYDRLLERARVEPDFGTRMALYAEAEELLIADAGIIPLFHSPDYALIKPHIQGFIIEPFGAPFLRDVVVLPK